MDEVEQMMEGLVIDHSKFHWYVDLDYEFDACQFYDFCVDETNREVHEAERWFRYAPEYPRAPYILKINLTNISKNTPAKVHTTSSQKLEAYEDVSASVITSDCGKPSSEEKQEVGSHLNCFNLVADDHIAKAKSMSASRLSKPSRTFMKPTASHLAKQIDNCGRFGCETGDTKRQKLEIGFLRKVSQLKHQTSFSHKTTTKDAQLDASSNTRSKTTIPQKPKLMTEERARRRSFRSKSKAEADNHTFKALPLNRKILESPSLPKRKKSLPVHSPVLQKFQFTSTSSQPMQRRSANKLNTHTSDSTTRSENMTSKRLNSFLPCVFGNRSPL